ncbi:hypothetical protein MY494_00885 [Synechococcus sp. A10-1-5-1]|uniref:hypothetical protein n=1 Tax=Synechococcus sp. A10-1-5-1 TaxID=2936507 RepID=UPI002001C016|nr:hypothetical protein [Synechococcus sp. A10-1-5-1]UPM50392.1 hypothetical protein MY494_00885 [Synechococcus sp. A10-1-5-1]
MRADLLLRAQELWRRNRQGTLPAPAWWPADLAPLFWPGLGLLLVALALGSTTLLLNRWPITPNAVEAPAPSSVIQEELVPQQAPKAISEPTAAQEAPLPPSPLEEALMAPIQEPPADLEPEGLEGPYAPDPLVELVQRPEADGLLVQAEGVADQSLLILQVRRAFPALSQQEQQRRAELWQQWALQLGYDHLELRDSRSGLIARDALVGEGMIVLAESPST